MRRQMPSPPQAAAGFLALVFLVAGLAFVTPAQAATRHSHHVRRHSVSRSHSRHRAHVRHASYRHHRRSHARHRASRGQRSIEPERAAEIQEALIRAHYLDGTPSGHWDAATEAAMQKYQADNGWQSKIAPDSRALIKLGLGPKRDKDEYSSAPSSGVSKNTGARPADPIRTLAASVLPTVRPN
jgi:hypothetical protein